MSHNNGNRPKITTADVAPTINNTVETADARVRNEDLDRPDLAIATQTSMNDPVTRKYVDDLAFMEQEVEFVIAKTHDKNDPNPIIAGVNGVSKVIQRGLRYKLPRKFLNVLLNSFTDVSTHEYIDKDGLSQTRIETITNPSLQVQVLHDPAGAEGMAWFARTQHGAY